MALINVFKATYLIMANIILRCPFARFGLPYLVLLSLFDKNLPSMLIAMTRNPLSALMSIMVRTAS
jgi:hypothetical protein